MIRVGILTSSRADYGIYLPLLKAMQQDKMFDIKLLVFGTHLSKLHGYTLSQIEQDGFPIFAKIESLHSGDSAHDIASSFALTTQKFADLWSENQNEFDIVFALGDRFEMAAAVAASIPYQINIAHLHGGETTLGAIDNIYRHFISLASNFHFVSTDSFAERVKEIIDSEYKKVYNIGSLSLENLSNLALLSLKEFHEKWNIDLQLETILVTVHPETIDFEKNIDYCVEITEALLQLSSKFQIVITMPNADTNGLIFRNSFEKIAQENSKIKIIENFGTQSYFTCMKYAKLLIGNTSSGIIEAASFQKYVLNIGDRQKGRLSSENVIHLPFEAEIIIRNAKNYITQTFEGENIYFQANPSHKVINILKDYYDAIS